MSSDGELLRRYAEAGSEESFTELVRRHVDLVYSAALRQVNGDSHLAQDVAQSVFTDLARKARPLSHRPILTGWLYTSTRFATARAVRSNRRRHTREYEAQTMSELLQDPAPELDWARIRTVLDETMSELKEADREAILLRYFENRSLTDVGVRLGLSENAARMRVDRALEKLRVRLARKGLTSTVSALALALAGNAVTAAPANMATALTAGALAGMAGTGSTFTLLKIMAMTKLKTGIVGAILVAAAATLLVLQHRAQVDLRRENEALRRQVATLEPLTAENQRLSNSLSALQTRVQSAPQVANDQRQEVLRLRGQVTRLQADAREQARQRSGLPDALTNAMAAGLSSADQWKTKQALSRLARMKQDLNLAPYQEQMIREIMQAFLGPQDGGTPR